MISARDGIPDDAVNLHASAVVLDAAAVLITGDSGAGKTHLALRLLQHWREAGRFARLLADDQVYVMRRGDRLLARTPRAIAGLAEVRGVGIVTLPFQSAAPVDLVVRLDDRAIGPAVDAAAAEVPSTVTIEAVELALLSLPRRDSKGSCLAVAAALAAIRSALPRKNAENMLASDNDLGLPSKGGRTT